MSGRISHCHCCQNQLCECSQYQCDDCGACTVCCECDDDDHITDAEDDRDVTPKQPLEAKW